MTSNEMMRRGSDPELETLGIHEGTFSESFIIGHYDLDTNAPIRTILATIFASNLWTLLMSMIPVLYEVGPNDYYTQPGWYTGDDIMRLLEPIGGLLFNCAILYQSGLFNRLSSKDRKEEHFSLLVCLSLFVLGAAIYEQGAGFHSAANMFKNALETVRDTSTDNDDPTSRGYDNLHYYMRTVWEHEVGHYLYAVGYVIMNICQLYAFKDLKAPSLGLTRTSKTLLTLSSLGYGVLIAGVAIDFPSGLIVGLIYVLLGLILLSIYLYHLHRVQQDSSALQGYGSRPVLHHFVLSYLWGLVFMVIWIAWNGGFVTRSHSSKV